MTTFVVTVTRRLIEHRWRAVVPQIEEIRVEARTLAGLDPELRDDIGTALGLTKRDRMGLTFDYQISTGDDELDAELKALRDARAVERKVASFTQPHTARLSRNLRNQKYSARDIAELLDVSHQRVTQILKPARDDSTKIN